MSSAENAGLKLKIIQKTLGDPAGFYLLLPAKLRNRLELRVGDRIKLEIKRVIKCDGKIINAQEKEEGIWPVLGYWNELHIPKETTKKFSLKKGDSLEIILKAVVRGGDESTITITKENRKEV